MHNPDHTSQTASAITDLQALLQRAVKAIQGDDNHTAMSILLKVQEGAGQVQESIARHTGEWAPPDMIEREARALARQEQFRAQLAARLQQDRQEAITA